MVFAGDMAGMLRCMGDLNLVYYCVRMGEGWRGASERRRDVKSGFRYAKHSDEPLKRKAGGVKPSCLPYNPRPFAHSIIHSIQFPLE